MDNVDVLIKQLQDAHMESSRDTAESISSIVRVLDAMSARIAELEDRVAKHDGNFQELLRG